MARRVLLLTTPFDDRARLDGTRRAVLDLVPALAAHDLEATVLARPAVDVPGARVLRVPTARAFVDPAAILATIAPHLGAFDLVHALFAPRLRTVLALRAIERFVPVVHTITSLPSREVPHLTHSIATSRASGKRLGLPVILMPFLPEPAPAPADVRDLLLFAGDASPGGGLAEAAAAFAAMTPREGCLPVLGIATRAKSAADLADARDVCQATVGATLLGELPSLLPHLAAARAVVLPASHTHGKLDHPRVLLEALALGTRVVVGSAPSLAELVPDPSLGVVAPNAPTLRAALEGAFSARRPDRAATEEVLAPRSPRFIAAAYADLYETAWRRPVR